MKKKLLVLVMALASVVAVTGCEEKKDNNEEKKVEENKVLNCTFDLPGEVIKLTFDYNGDKYTKLTMVDTTAYNNEKDAKKAVTSKKEIIESYKGLEYTITNNNSNTIETYVFNVNEMDDKAKELYEQSFKEFTNKNFNELKDFLTNNKYKCE